MTAEEQLVQLEIIKTTGASLLHETSAHIFIEKLAAYINELVNHDFAKLVGWLYRLDVSEKKLKESLKDNAAADAGVIIADLIIERQLKKIKSRKEFKQNGENIADEEKW